MKYLNVLHFSKHFLTINTIYARTLYKENINVTVYYIGSTLKNMEAIAKWIFMQKSV